MMSDADGYPTDEELKRIEEWPFEAGLREWFAYIKAAGHYWPKGIFGWCEADHDADELFSRPYHAYYVSTGGWSGNESIIDAMQKNFVCWQLTWYSHRRGGHYEFRVRPDGQGGAL